MKGVIIMESKLNDNYYYDVIRKNIRKFRKEKGFTQQQLAEKADLSSDYICEIESLKKQKSFSIATLGRISEALKVEITRFFEEQWCSFFIGFFLIM